MRLAAFVGSARSVLGRLLSGRAVHTRLTHLLVHIVLLGITFTCLVPLAYMVSTSLKPHGTETEFPVRWIPERVAWENFPAALSMVPTLTFLKNTLVITAICLVGELLTASLAAYGFARLRFPGRDVLFTIMLATLMLPFWVTMIPLFALYRTLKWIDTLYPLTVPAFFGGSPLYIFLLRQFYLTLPVELDEAAKIDGAGFFRIWWSVLMPLARPALGTMVVLSVVAHWNDFTGPLIFLNSTKNFTMALGTRMFQKSYSYDTYFNLTMAYCTVMTIPVILVFFIFQEYLIRGIAATGLTGR